MDEIQKHLKLLGLTVTDRVTGISGVVVSVSFDLYGCVQALVHPGSEGGKLLEVSWMDVARLQTLGREPVMAPPTFTTELSGPADKPIPSNA